MASNPFGGFLQKMKGFADEAKRKKYREQVERDIVLYKDKGFRKKPLHRLRVSPSLCFRV